MRGIWWKNCSDNTPWWVTNPRYNPVVIADWRCLFLFFGGLGNDATILSKKGTLTWSENASPCIPLSSQDLNAIPHMEENFGMSRNLTIHVFFKGHQENIYTARGPDEFWLLLVFVDNLPGGFGGWSVARKAPNKSLTFVMSWWLCLVQSVVGWWDESGCSSFTGILRGIIKTCIFFKCVYNLYSRINSSSEWNHFTTTYHLTKFHRKMNHSYQLRNLRTI